MSQQNSEAQAMGMGLALVGVAFALLFFVLYAVACFVAIVLTIVALYALDHGLTIFGQTITPREARIFLASGVAGLIAVPLFALFCAALLQARFPGDWWPYILLGGYSFGAIGLSAAILGDEKTQVVAQAPAAPPATPPSLPSPPAGPVGQAAPPPVPAEAFRFASWDDETAHVTAVEARSSSRAVTTLRMGVGQPDPGRDCRACMTYEKLSQEEIQLLVAKYVRGVQ